MKDIILSQDIPDTKTFPNEAKTLAKLAGEFDWAYISGRMRGKKWKWWSQDGYYYPHKNELSDTASRLALTLIEHFNATNYMESGGIHFEVDKKAKTITLWFGKNCHKPWITATESYA